VIYNPALHAKIRAAALLPFGITAAGSEITSQAI
jgi:hypothetical protein